MYEVSQGSKWQYHHIDSTHANLDDAIKAALWLVYCYNEEQRKLYLYENYDEFAVDDTIHLIDYPKMVKTDNFLYELSWNCKDDYITINKIKMNTEVKKLYEAIENNEISELDLEFLLKSVYQHGLVNGSNGSYILFENTLNEILTDLKL